MSERCVRTSGLLVIAAASVLILSLFTRHADPTVFADDLTLPDAEAVAIRASAQFSPTAWVLLAVGDKPTVWTCAPGQCAHFSERYLSPRRPSFGLAK